MNGVWGKAALHVDINCIGLAENGNGILILDR